MHSDVIGQRMKNNYENISKTKLLRRTPVAIRIDGKAFHTFTRGLKRPYDSILMKSMQETMKYLCKNIQGCVFGYTESDEITLILIDYQTLETDAWFDYEVQKLCSISASMATMKFNQIFSAEVQHYVNSCLDSSAVYKYNRDYCSALEKAVEKGAMFDARCFNIPKEEVTNLIYWRQTDAIRNSIQAVGQYYFSFKQLHGKSSEQIKEMLKQEKDVNWDGDYSLAFQRGVCCIKTDNGWDLDYYIPIFKGPGRQYVEQFI